MEDKNLINLFVLMIINFLSYLALLSCAMSLVEYILHCWKDKLKNEDDHRNISIRNIAIIFASVIICLIYLACGLHYEILCNGKIILIIIAIGGLVIHLWIMHSKVKKAKSLIK